MEQKQTAQKPEAERKGQSGSVLSDKEKFEHSGSDEALKQMGEKTREANKDK
jgi:hypothetical protein